MDLDLEKLFGLDADDLFEDSAKAATEPAQPVINDTTLSGSTQKPAETPAPTTTAEVVPAQTPAVVTPEPIKPVETPPAQTPAIIAEVKPVEVTSTPQTAPSTESSDFAFTMPFEGTTLPDISFDASDSDGMFSKEVMEHMKKSIPDKLRENEERAQKEAQIFGKMRELAQTPGFNEVLTEFIVRSWLEARKTKEKTQESK